MILESVILESLQVSCVLYPLVFSSTCGGCRLVEDTAWHPVSKEELVQWKGTFKGWLFKTFLGSPLKSWASVGHWLIWHFDTSKYSDKQQNRVSTPGSELLLSGPGCSLAS